MEELDLFISLQTPLKEEVFDEADNINGRELDLRVFNSRLLVVWAYHSQGWQACKETF